VINPLVGVGKSQKKLIQINKEVKEDYKTPKANKKVFKPLKEDK